MSFVLDAYPNPKTFFEAALCLHSPVNCTLNRSWPMRSCFKVDSGTQTRKRCECGDSPDSFERQIGSLERSAGARSMLSAFRSSACLRQGRTNKRCSLTLDVPQQRRHYRSAAMHRREQLTEVSTQHSLSFLPGERNPLSRAGRAVFVTSLQASTAPHWMSTPVPGYCKLFEDRLLKRQAATRFSIACVEFDGLQTTAAQLPKHAGQGLTALQDHKIRAMTAATPSQTSTSNEIDQCGGVSDI
jgi:hypothetical protein